MAKEIRAQCGPDFILLSGDDGTYPEFLEAGGNGIISVATHIVPDLFVKLLSGKENAQSFRKYLPLIGLLFAEANPIPVKKALQLLGVIEAASLRLPLCELEEHLTRDLLAELETLELL